MSTNMVSNVVSSNYFIFIDKLPWSFYVPIVAVWSTVFDRIFDKATS